jgi:hypothetical protein
MVNCRCCSLRLESGGCLHRNKHAVKQAHLGIIKNVLIHFEKLFFPLNL